MQSKDVSGREALPIVPRAGAAKLGGFVLDATGGPVPGAWVVAREPASGAITAKTESTADGRFEFDVAPGDVVLEARANAYSTGSLLAVAPSQANVLSLTPASGIAGRVTAAGSGAPIAELTIFAVRFDGIMPAPATARSEPGGSFRFDELTAGSYEVSAIGSSWRAEARRVEVEVGQITEPVLLDAASATLLSARVRVGHEPCGQGFVHVSGPVTASAPIGAEGTVRLEGLLPGHYRVSVGCAQALELREELDIGTEPALRDWQLEAGLRVSGRVETGSGEPVPGAHVLVAPVGEPAAPTTGHCSSDRAGEFDCAGLAPGEYECKVTDYWQAQSAPVRVTLSPSSEPDIVLRTLSAGSIRVTLRDADSVSPTSINVWARSERAALAPAARQGSEFVFERLKLDRYLVFVETADEGAEASAVPVTLEREGQVVSVELAVPPTHSISGHVLDERGVPVVDAWVLGSPANPTSLLDRSGPVLTDDRGAFTITGLLPGRYELHATSSWGKGFEPDIESGAEAIVVRVQNHTDRSGEDR